MAPLFITFAVLHLHMDKLHIKMTKEITIIQKEIVNFRFSSMVDLRLNSLKIQNIQKIQKVQNSIFGSIKIMVTKYFRNSKFSDFEGIKSETNLIPVDFWPRMTFDITQKQIHSLVIITSF